MAGETIVLGKDVSYTGINNVREATITSTWGEADSTIKGQASRSFTRTWIEQTLEATTVGDPGCGVGDDITVSVNAGNGHDLDAVVFLVTGVTKDESLDDVFTYSVSATRGVQPPA